MTLGTDTVAPVAWPPEPSTRTPRRSGTRRVLRVVGRQEPLLLVSFREAEIDQDGTEQDGDDPGGVSPVSAVEERRLRRRRDLARVLRVLLRYRLCSGEGLRELARNAVGDLLLVRRRRDCRGDRGRVPGRQERAEDRLHDRAAEIALEVRRTRGHPGPRD